MIERLHYISQQKNGSHITAIQHALKAGCKWVQLRIKNETEDFILEQAIAANELCKKFSANLILNDYPALAFKAGAYGVHLGLQDMSVKEARELTEGKLIIGGTANTFEHIAQRANEGADYVGLGPFRFTTTKQNLSPVLGLVGFATLMQQMQQAGLTIPVIAIGGILPTDVESIMQTGVNGVAVSGAITHAENPAEAVNYIYTQLNSGQLKSASN